jgi:hypothetical protein
MANHLIHPGFVGAYVYALTVDGVVRYIGKGRRYRAIEHFRVARDINSRRAAGEKVKALPVHNKLAKALREGRSLDYQIIANGLTDAAAYELERAQIAQAPAGQLWNLHSGGSGGDREMMKALWADPAFRAFCLQRQSEGRAADPNWRDKARQKTEEVWANATFRERWMKQHRALWDDPVAAEERRELLRRVWADPERAARKRELVRSQWTPERRAAMSENRRQAWADPEFKRKAMESVRRSRTPEVRARLSEAARKQWADPEHRADRIARIRASKAK